MALLAANGCKSTSSNAPTAANNNPVNGSGTRSALVSAGNDPTSLNTKTPPPGPDLYVSTARVYEGTQNIEAAKAQYERALKIDPAYLPALLGYAHLLDTQKEFTEADTYYKLAVKKHPEVAAVFNDWGMSQQRRGHLEESAKLLTKATRLQPEKALYRNNLAMVLVVTHRPQEAYRQLAAIEAPPVAHFNVAALLHRAGDDHLAAYHFAEASKEDPKWEQAREWAERLGGPAAPVANNAIVVSSGPRLPPPDPQPDPAAGQYLVAQRTPIVNQANAPSPGPAQPYMPTQPPVPSPEPAISPSPSYSAIDNGSAQNGAIIVNPTAAESSPAYGAVTPGPVTPTSGISYPAQYTSASPAVNGPPTGESIEAMPPLPPSAAPAGESQRGLVPLPPVR
jgi:Tfp pilus assembly protein PilF